MKLTITGLSKRIETKPVLTDIAFDWTPGEIIGLVGQNGAGKTTLMRTLVDQYQPDHGTIELDGQDLRTHPEARANLIYIDPSQTFFGRYTLDHLGQFYQLAYPNFDRQRFLQLLADYDLAPTQRYNSLSKGYQALVVIILTVSTNAPFALLDEPFDGLDLFIRDAIVELVVGETATGSRGFLIASHNLPELDGIADRILFMKRNTISHDYALEELRTQAVKLQLVFKQPTVPDVVRENGQILSIRGRVIEALFTAYTPAVDNAIDALNPVVKSELPLALSDLFRGEFAHLQRGEQHV